ncbi:Eco29kI family restriction endonuclease [Shewanella sp. 1180_01]|uniref:Eco29kI family restriction endonuclease n=1 Tax=Shewanella sp. 1180_01 TaxID=2604451 RepID=UPI004062EC7F
MSAEIIPFNPLDKKNLGASVAEAMFTGQVHQLGELNAFSGAGIYAIYYSGNFRQYEEISKRNKDGIMTAPIYVGKAVPAGSRKGMGATSNYTGKALYSRLSEHAESIRSTSNLKIEDFTCRFLVVDDIWIPLGESLLIARYSPLWNAIIDGFGNHDPGSGRYNGMRPRWDVLHPGRGWAIKCKERVETAEDIARDVSTYLSNATFPTSNRFITTENT